MLLAQIWQQREQLVAQEREETFKKFYGRTSPEQLLAMQRQLQLMKEGKWPPKEGAGGAMIIGAAALAALLLLR
jgi:hypothetical protein